MEEFKAKWYKNLFLTQINWEKAEQTKISLRN